MSDYMNYQTGVQCTVNIVTDAQQFLSDRYAKKINDVIDRQISSVYEKDIANLERQGKENLASLETALENARSRQGEILNRPLKFEAEDRDSYFKYDDIGTLSNASDHAINNYADRYSDIESLHRNINKSAEYEKYSREATETTTVSPSSDTIRSMIDVENQLHTKEINNFEGLDLEKGETSGNVADLTLNSYEYLESNGQRYFTRTDENGREHTYLDAEEGIYEYRDYGIKRDGNSVDYSRGNWEFVAGRENVTYDKSYNNHTLTAYESEELKALGKTISKLEGEIDTQKTNLDKIHSGKEMRLGFNNKRDLRKFVFDMENKGINVSVIANKLNGQYLVATADVYSDTITEYAKSEGMEIHGYKNYNVYDTKSDAFGRDLGNSYGSVIERNIRSTETGAEQYKMIRKYNLYQQFRYNHEKKSTRELRHDAFEDMDKAVKSINANQSPDTDRKYGEIWNRGKGKDDTKMDTKSMLTQINDTTGKKLGIDIFNSKSITSDTIRMRKEILLKYNGIIKVDRKGNIDQRAIMDLKSGKTQFLNREMPSEAELNFLLMTGQSSDKVSLMGQAIGEIKNLTVQGLFGENIALWRDGSRLVMRAKQMAKLSKSTYKLVRENISEKIVSVKMNRMEKNPNKYLDRQKEKVKRPSKGSMVKRPGGDEGFFGRHKAKKQKKRIKKMARKDERRERRKDFLDKILIGRIAGKIGGVMDRLNFIKRFRNHTARKLIAKGGWKGQWGKMIQKGGMLGGTFSFIKTKLYLLGGMLGGFLILISAVVMMFAGVISLILSFFNDPDVEDTVMYKMYERLCYEEDKWMEIGTDPDKIWERRFGLKYGSIEDGSFMNLEEYIDFLNAKGIDSGANGKGRIYAVGTGEDMKIYINPFGFDLSKETAEDVLKEIDKPDGTDNKWNISPYGTSDHTENIKDILCMTDVMFQFDTGDMSDDWLKQSMSDGWFVFEFKDFANGVRNFFKRIGCWFTGDDYEEEKELETSDYGIVKAYAVGLFDASHQEAVEFLPVILPVSDEDNVKGYCPEADGCMETDYLSCDTDGTEDYCTLLGADGAYHRIYDVHFKNEKDRCISHTFASDEKTFKIIDSSDCWEDEEGKTTETHSGSSPSGLQDYRETGSAVSSKTTSYINEYDSSSKTFTRTEKVTWYKTYYYTYTSVTSVPVYDKNGVIVGWETVETPDCTGSYYVDYEEKTPTVYTHKCEGEHTGSFCGGHLSIKVNGYVWSFPSYLCENEEIDPDTVKKVEKMDTSLSFRDAVLNAGENLAIASDGTWSRDRFDDASNEGIIEKNVMSCEDIFDVANLIKYGQNVFPVHNNWKNYSSWTLDNINLSVLRYQQNWNEVYEFDIETNYGVKKLSASDKAKILDGLEAHYGELSNDRKGALMLALDAVGNGAYSMEHHAHAYLTDICPVTGNMCKTTDCSGFASYIYMWYDKLDHCCATDGLVSGATLFKNWDELKPADMLIHWSGQTSSQALENGGAGSHALIFIGFVDEPIELSTGITIEPGHPVTVDCLSFYSYKPITSFRDCFDCGAGNIYLRHTGSNSPYKASRYLMMPDGRLYVRKFE